MVLPRCFFFALWNKSRYHPKSFAWFCFVLSCFVLPVSSQVDHDSALQFLQCWRLCAEMSRRIILQTHMFVSEHQEDAEPLHCSPDLACSFTASPPQWRQPEPSDELVCFLSTRRGTLSPPRRPIKGGIHPEVCF